MNKRIFTLARKMLSMLYLTERVKKMFKKKKKKKILFQNGDSIEGVVAISNGYHTLKVWEKTTPP